MLSILLPIIHNTNCDKLYDSILNQTYIDFELITNKPLTVNDDRIKVVPINLGTYNEVVSKLNDQTNSKLVVPLNEYCLLNHHYIKYLISNLTDNINAVYSNGSYLNDENRMTSKIINDDHCVYKPKQSIIKNFCKSVHYRRAFSFNFGLFRKETFDQLMNWPEVYDVNKFHDVLFSMKFFFLKNKANIVNYPLLFYIQNQKLDILGNENPIIIWAKYIQSQLQLYNKISTLTQNKKMIATTMDSCFNECYRVLKLFEKYIAVDEFEKELIQEILSKYEPITKLKFTNIFKPSKKDIDNLSIRCRILNKRVLSYTEDILQNPEVIKEIQNSISEVKNHICQLS